MAERWGRIQAELFSLFSRYPKSNRVAVEQAGLTASDRALDIGCGHGSAVRAAAEVCESAIGVDSSPAMVSIATRRSQDSRATFHVGSAEDLPLGDESVTVAWTVRAFHHWENEDKGITEVRRVLQPGGRFLIVERKAKHHGLTPERAEELIERLGTIGFADAHHRTAQKLLIVEATRS